MKNHNPFPMDHEHVNTDPVAWALEDLPEGGYALPTLWRTGTRPHFRTVTDLRDLGPLQAYWARDNHLTVAEWEVHRICRFCSSSFSFTVASDPYGRPTRKGDGDKVYCNRECMTTAVKHRASEEAAAGKFASKRLTPEDGETLVGLVANTIEVWEALGVMAKVVGVLGDREKATTATVKEISRQIALLEAMVNAHARQVEDHRAELVEHRDRIEALEAEISKIRKA